MRSIREIRRDNLLLLLADARRLGKTQQQFAKEVGLNPVYLSQIVVEGRGRFPGHSSCRQIERAQELAEGWMDQPRASLGADGSGFEVGDPADGSVRTIGFTDKFLAQLGLEGSAWTLIEIRDDNMGETLQPGDLVLVDTSDTSGMVGIMLVEISGGSRMVARVHRDPSRGVVRVLSDDSARYPPMNVPADKVLVIGRCVWYGRAIS